ncbi:hypothetical protein SLS62_006827 [Diatrype stigma]|uniref:Uncharacterized protein n=1 Tax=Diatrype stigma TaxID=117547 RepID=A0AAN9YNU6_9PEZI
MSDRPPPQVIRPGPVRGARAAAAAAANTAGVRRNLFQSQLMSRRHPTPPLTSNNHGTATATTGAAAGGGARTGSQSSGSGETLRLDASVDVLSDDAGSSSEIVVRDRNGEFEVGDPPTPPLLLDDPGAEEAGGGALDDALENEQVLEILRASMRAQVAALAEDNWMFEAEDQLRP